MKRRGLLMGAVAALAAMTLPAFAVRRVPVLYGDGEHDDTEAIQAVLNGEEVRMADGSPVPLLHVPPGEYVVNSTLLIRKEFTSMAGCIFTAGPQFPMLEPFLRVEGVKNVAISENVFNLGHRAGSFMEVRDTLPEDAPGLSRAIADGRAYRGQLGWTWFN